MNIGTNHPLSRLLHRGGRSAIVAVLSFVAALHTTSVGRGDASGPVLIAPESHMGLCATDSWSVDSAFENNLVLDVDPLGRIPIIFHIIRDDTGGDGYWARSGDPAADLQEAVDYTNTRFPDPPSDPDYDGPVFRRFEFYIEEIIDGKTTASHRNSGYLEITEDEKDNLRLSLRKPGRINVFLVNRLLDGGVIGLASLPGSPAQGIILDSQAVGPGPLLPHEIAHYFFVLHTHESEIFGPELVSRDPANCAYRGDRVCDTPADPGVGFQWVSGDSCAYVGNYLDPAGVPYDPDPYNIVSNAVGHCPTRFTPGQLERMTQAFDHRIVGEVAPRLPEDLSVLAFPNPLSASQSDVTIRFETPGGFWNGTVSVVDVQGKRVRTIYNGWIDGVDTTWELHWDGRNDNGARVVSGIYFVRILLESNKSGPAVGSAKVEIVR